MSTERRLGKTPLPPRLVSPGRFGNRRPLQALHEHRPLPGHDSLSPQAGEPGPLGTAIPYRPSMSTDHRQGRCPRPQRLVSPGHWELPPPTGPS